MEGLLLGALFSLASLIVGSLWIAGVVYILVDAQRREVKGAAYWALGALFTGPLALVAYLIDRPKSRMLPCSFCTRPILESDARCPYCSREQPRRPPGDEVS